MGDRQKESQPQSLPAPEGKVAEKLAARDRLNFRPWLWLQHHQETKFKDLARLVLSGGPESIWVSKPIRPQQVCWDIEQFYASGQTGIIERHVKQAREAISAYYDDERSVSDLIEERERKEESATKSLSRAVSEAAWGAAGEDAAGAGVYLPAVHRLKEGGLVETECSYVRSKNGMRCQRRAVIGTTRCDIHGGEYMDPEEIREFIRSGQERIVAASAAAIDTVIDLMQNSVQDPIRLKAAEMLLDRAGLKPGMEIGAQQPGATSAQKPSEILNDRLSRLAEHHVVDQDGNSVNGDS